LAKNEAGLDGFPKPHGIGDQDSGVTLAKHRECGLELIGMKIDRAGGSGKQTAKWSRVDRGALD
jgi:hypothetical protein